MTKCILWIAFALAIAYCMIQPAFPEVGLGIGLFSLGLFMWGCARYGASKGYSRGLGVVLGILNAVGLIILYLLPTKVPESAGPRPRLEA